MISGGRKQSKNQKVQTRITEPVLVAVNDSMQEPDLGEM